MDSVSDNPEFRHEAGGWIYMDKTSGEISVCRAASTEVEAPRLSCDEVLRIARTDAETAHRDVSRYTIRIAEESDGWHIDYELKDERARGGGPYYVVHPITGEIVAKRYEQ